MILSPSFDVKETSYGGRGCFAKEKILAGTKVFETNSPLSSTIARPFKKEVCSWCFTYKNGLNLKFRIDNLAHFYFCSSSCIEQFEEWDSDKVYRTNIVLIEDNYMKALKKPMIELSEPEISQQVINDHWSEINQWELKLPHKHTQRINQIPRIDENELMEIKYVVGILFELYKSNHPELEVFHELQSDELLKLSKYPALLESYSRAYKFMKIVLDDSLQKYITTDSFREFVGKNFSNAFGIWSLDNEEDREFFGFTVFPSASFFNHSCASNLKKIPYGRSMAFIAKSDIDVGQELCINYGNTQYEDVESRQKDLQEWHFKCQCIKCVIDLQTT